VRDLVGEEFKELRRLGIEARLFDNSPDGQPIYSEGGPVGPHPSVEWLRIASRRWAVAFGPTPEFAASQSHAQSRIVLAGGLAFTVLVTAYGFNDWRRSKALAAANAALQEEVTVRQRTEAAASAASEAKSGFLASMSHEIRTPLNAILGYAQLMKRDARMLPDQLYAISGISTSGGHLLGLVNEILDFSRIEAGRMELNLAEFDLKVLARDLAATFSPLCAEKNIRFRVEIQSREQTSVQGDEGKLRQVLINLIGNAVKFTASGEVTCNFRPLDQQDWLFEVLDTGPGIPEDERTNIFKPFHQGHGARNQGGTGLGLAIAQRQVELLGGTLAMDRDQRPGSRFFFQVPLAPAPAILKSEAEAAAPIPKDTARVTDLVLLPEALCARLMGAAEVHSTTALKACLQDLSGQGPGAERLAGEIGSLMRRYDMEAIPRLLAMAATADGCNVSNAT
jgi:signal transduction histidine kinase